MKKIIEYLMIFATTLFFCPSNYYSFIYMIIAAFVSLFYLLVYYSIRRKSNVKKEKYQLDFSTIIVCLMIVTINLVNKVEITNLIFGIYTSLVLFIYSLMLLFKKDEFKENKIFQNTYLFDFYTIVYLTGLIIKLLSYEI